VSSFKIIGIALRGNIKPLAGQVVNNIFIIKAINILNVCSRSPGLAARILRDIEKSKKRKELLKHMIMQLHSGEAPEIVKNRLATLLTSIPYNEVVHVEQELIAEGLPVEEVLRLCDIHQLVLDGHIDQSNVKEGDE